MMDATVNDTERLCMSDELEQRLSHLEEVHEAVKMQNRVLSTALKGLIRALPADFAQEAIESIQAAFDEAVDELHYEDHPHAELFHDVAYDFFREKQR